MTEPSDLDRLITAVKDCQTILAAFVGIPRDLSDEGAPLHEFDAAKRDFVLVDAEQVPSVLWRSVIVALDMLSVGVGFAERGAPTSEGSFEEDVAALLRARRSK